MTRTAHPTPAPPGVDRRFTAVAAALVVVSGALVSLRPIFAVALLGLLVLAGLVWMPPVLRLVLLLGITAIVPYGVQNDLGIGGRSGSPGLLLTDLLLISGLIRVVPQLFTAPIGRRLRVGALLVAAFLGIAGLQFLHGLAAGRDPSTVGAEFRVLLGFAAFLLAVPIVADEGQRRKLLRTLPWLGLAVGVWGLTQWVFDLSFTEAADSGVQAGIRFTTAGRGQLQGGLFAFPVAVVVALGALMSDELRSARTRLLLLVVLVLNSVCLLLTYERTFWLATLVAGAFVVARSGGLQRFRAVVWTAAVGLLAFAALATLAPAELTAARERLTSLSQYRSDDSLRFRVAESRYVLEQIEARPVLGSGLGATIFFGRPWDKVPPESLTFSHNGYLWLAWKLGIVGAAALLAVLFSSVGWLARPADESVEEAVRNGVHGALLVLIIASVNFPSFNQLGITAVMGVLMAIACAPRPVRRGQETASSVWP